MKAYTEQKAESFLNKSLPIAKSKITKNLKQATEFSRKIKFPLVIKLSSDKLLHKSDIGAVKIVNCSEDLGKEYNHLLKIAKDHKIRLKGILVQEYIEGHQAIVGAKRDPTFGPVVIFGIGGIYTELLKDTSIRICPIKKQDALSMINETKFSKILQGYRGEKADIDAVAEIILKVSRIMTRNKKIQEIDINPLVIGSKCKIVDARIIFS